MSNIAAFHQFMTQTISVAPPGTKDTFGNVTYGTAVTYKCRLVGKRQLTIDREGRETMSRQTVYLGTNAVVDPESLVTLSTADVGSTESWAINPPIVSSALYPDENGHHHSVLYLR